MKVSMLVVDIEMDPLKATEILNGPNPEADIVSFFQNRHDMTPHSASCTLRDVRSALADHLVETHLENAKQLEYKV